MHKNVGKKWDRLEQRKSGTAGNLAPKSGTVGDYDTYMCEKFLECVLVCAGLSISCVPMVGVGVCVCVCVHACVHYTSSDHVLCMVMVDSTNISLIGMNHYTCEPVVTYVCK